MARGSILTPEVKTRIVNVLKGGGTEASAYTAAGVSSSTYYRWLQKGRQSRRGRYRELWEEIRRAEQDAVIRNVTIVQKAAMGGDVIEQTTTIKPDGTRVIREKKSQPQWQAATWWLERKYPGEWSRRERVEHTAPHGPLISENFILIEDRVGRRIPAIEIESSSSDD
jgi:transposase-like protein